MSEAAPGAEWNVYMVRCGDGSLYTGIARDVSRRIDEHNLDDGLAARYTRSRRPVALVYREGVASRAAAARREREIKQLPRAGKLLLLANFSTAV